MEPRVEVSFIRDSKTMLMRNLKLSFRTPGAIGLALVMPASMLIVFVFIFGGSMDVGDIRFIDYIVPGIILLTIGQCAPGISVRLSNDLSNGIIARFHTMPIVRSSILVGHVIAAILQNMLTVIITIFTAFLLGFRPQADLKNWLLASLIIFLYISMMMWLATLSGLYAKSPEGASELMTLISVLPFLSSAFVPTATMPTILKIFAENQPMTSILDSVRFLLLNEELPSGTLRLALFWCVGLGLICCILSLNSYWKKMGNK
jgi:ABC-2 type transport system permease protein